MSSDTDNPSPPHLQISFNAALQGLQSFAPLVVLYGASSLKIEENGLLPQVRGIYLGINLFLGTMLWYIRGRIIKKYKKSKSDKKDSKEKDSSDDTISVPEVVQMGQVVKPARTLTRLEYDLDAFQEEARKFAMNVTILTLIHYKWEAVLPILLQCVTGPLQFLCSPLFQAYILHPLFGLYPGALLSPEEEKGSNGPLPLPTAQELVNRRPFPAAKSIFNDLKNSWGDVQKAANQIKEESTLIDGAERNEENIKKIMENGGGKKVIEKDEVKKEDVKAKEMKDVTSESKVPEKKSNNKKSGENDDPIARARKSMQSRGRKFE